ncbi:hypothetical protein GCM10022243_15440 [Saccharothrix violaceirubra]|uniref:Uncharacterized protein n=1 Tax=Saccharothrix violaceirubra TaxID=413306 RepID=A0A7W7T6G4_9PSEU|nr:hypothetical protein [Saccharothrix violaceirubra]MBB4967420.1 hypothetical protein [Saccharothrix violaceirubra]
MVDTIEDGDLDDYERFVAEMIADDRPSLFAVLAEYGERTDAEIAAWGLAWPDHVEVVLAGGGRLKSSSTERVATFVRRTRRGCRVRIVRADDLPAPRA